MSHTPSIFISYNSKSPDEETLAVRLQTIGAVNGFTTYLPDRFRGNGYVDEETIRRISSSDYYVLFATSKISKIVQEEIDIAYEYFQDASRIIIIYNQHSKNNIKLLHPTHATLISFDSSTETTDKIITKVVRKIRHTEETKRKQEPENGLLALLGIGLGLIILATLFNNDD